jgi:Flp pilus assembly pilin Flp
MNQFQKLIGLRFALALGGTPLVGIEREEGQTLAEYALILALIAVIAVLALIFLGGTITGLFSKVGNSV